MPAIKIDTTELLDVLQVTPPEQNIMLVGRHGITGPNSRSELGRFSVRTQVAWIARYTTSGRRKNSSGRLRLSLLNACECGNGFCIIFGRHTRGYLEMLREKIYQETERKVDSQTRSLLKSRQIRQKSAHKFQYDDAIRRAFA